VRLLQRLLDAAEDTLVRLEERGAVRWVSARAEAERLLAELPAEGREAYETLSGGRAARRLAEAKRDADPAGLLEGGRRFGQTRAGREALALLGSHHLDRGRPAVAAACFRRLLDRSTDNELSPRTLVVAALAFRMSADAAGEARAWAALERAGNAEVRL